MSKPDFRNENVGILMLGGRGCVVAKVDKCLPSHFQNCLFNFGQDSVTSLGMYPYV